MKPKKFTRKLITKIVKQDIIDEVINLNGCDLIEVDNWIFKQIRKRNDILFRYVGFEYGSRHMRIYTNDI